MDSVESATPGSVMRRLWIEVRVPVGETDQETELWVMTAIQQYRERNRPDEPIVTGDAMPALSQ